MKRHAPWGALLAGALALGLTGPAAAQISAQPLGSLDLWQVGERRPEIPSEVWRGTSATLAGEVLGRIDGRALPPAARRMALSLLGAAAAAPDGAAGDVALAAARARALLALGDPGAALAVLERTPGIEASAALTETAAEAALFLGRDEAACATGRAAQAGRDGAYSLKLRAFCDAVEGRSPAAQLNLSLLEQGGTRDETFVRLLGALLAGPGASPGAASLRTGLHAALSRRLALDLAPAVEGAAPPALAVLAGSAEASAAVRGVAEARARVLGLRPPAPLSTVEGDPFTAALAEADAALAEGGAPASDLLDRLVRLAAAAPKAAQPRVQAAALLLAAAGAPVPGEHRGGLLAFDAGPAQVGVARRLALDLAADAARAGEAGLLAVDAALALDGRNVRMADRVEIVRALREAGLPAWRDWAREGLAELAAPPPTAASRTRPGRLAPARSPAAQGAAPR